MVGVLACHSYPGLHTLLQKVVEQLASLGPPSAMVVVVTTVLETYHPVAVRHYAHQHGGQASQVPLLVPGPAQHEDCPL